MNTKDKILLGVYLASLVTVIGCNVITAVNSGRVDRLRDAFYRKWGDKLRAEAAATGDE